MRYHPRILDLELDELLPSVAAIAIDGPKGVGKTATASERAHGLLNLDSGTTRAVVRADPTTVLRAARPVLIDEWQRVPEVWDVIKRAVDDGAKPGSFLLAGSATPTRAVSLHSGAGRILSLRMRPMAMCERAVLDPTVSFRDLLAGDGPDVGGESPLELPDYVDEIESSGFPGIRGLAPRARRAQLDAYLDRSLGRDLSDHGAQVRRPQSLRAWVTAYAAATATTASYNAIARAATPGEGDSPSSMTAQRYREWLTELWLIDPIPAWLPPARSLGKLAHAPKHHLADPALAVRLLRVTSRDLAEGRGSTLASEGTPLLGTLFESLAALTVRTCAQAAEATVTHLRTERGEHEIDFVVEAHDGGILAFEAKLSTAIDDHDVRHLRWLRENNPRVRDTIVLNTGRYAYRRPDGVAVIPLALLGP